MKFTAFLHKKLVDLLAEHRIVVWYDAAGDFKEFVNQFSAPNCTVLSAAESTLRARREADEIYRLMIDSDDPAEARRNLLIYNPRPRGSGVEAKRRDLFEVFAVIGTAFGDTEDQRLESLARQAMPEMAAEITRLFAEGRPDIHLLDGLGEGYRYPLLREVLGTETPAEIIALSICDDNKSKAVDDTPGCGVELLRFFEHAIGFKPPTRQGGWNAVRDAAAGFVLYSEFLLGLSNGPPEELASVPAAGKDAEDTVRAACNRMRSDLSLQERYIELASRVEKNLRLNEIMGEDFLPSGCDTFPFEERRLLRSAGAHTVAGDFEAARHMIENSRVSIWRRDPRRAADWIALERAVTFLVAADNINKELDKHRTSAEMVKTYTGSWYALDRDHRLFEHALTAGDSENALADVKNRCRSIYRDIVERIQEKFLAAVKDGRWPPEGVARQTRVFDEYVAPAMERREKTAFFLVDSLRFEMGRDLGEALVDALGEAGEVKTEFAVGVVPTVTDYGMAALLPGADGMLGLVHHKGKLVPALGSKLLPGSADRMKLLQEIYGDRVLDVTLDDLLGSFKRYKSRLESVDLLVVRTQDPDSIAENLGEWRAYKYLSDTVGDIAAVVKTLASNGFTYMVVAADHGHMFFNEILPGDIVPEPAGEWIKSKRRCRLGSGLAAGPGTVTFKAEQVGIKGDVEDICIPVGFKVFSDGSGYFHGGLSLPEAVIPVVVLRATGEREVETGKPVIEIRYRSDRFTTQVIGLKIYLQENLFKQTEQVLVEAYDGKGARANLVGEAADCDARDERTRLVTLQAGQEIFVPVLIYPDFNGPYVQIRVIDPQTRVVWAKKDLINAKLE